MDDIAQLPHVSAPGLGPEDIKAILAQTLNALVVFAVEFLDEVFNQQRQILEAVAQRRKYCEIVIRSFLSCVSVERLPKFNNEPPTHFKFEYIGD